METVSTVFDTSKVESLVESCLTTALRGLPYAKKFFTFEGGEGSGKSTVSNRIYIALKGMYGEDKVVLVREPGSSPISEAVRDIVVNNRTEEHDIDVVTELLLFNAARNELLRETILPALREGKIVLCDRFVDSTIIYQCIMRSGNAIALNNILHLINCPLPSATFVLNVKAITGLERSTGGYIENKGLAYATNINACYAKMCTLDTRFTPIDTNDANSDETFNICLARIKSIIEDTDKPLFTIPEPQKDIYHSPLGYRLIPRKEVEERNAVEPIQQIEETKTEEHIEMTPEVQKVVSSLTNRTSKLARSAALRKGKTTSLAR